MKTIELLKQLIAIPSMHTDPEKKGLFAVVEHVEALFRDIDGITTRRHEYNGYPSIVISNTDALDVDVALSGHLDVVHARKQLFEPRIEGDWLYGRGALDMKSGVAAMISAFIAHRDAGPTMALMLTTDEEIGGFNGTKELLSTAGYRARVALIPDGGYKQNQIALKEKGVIRLHLSVEGVSAHASRPWQGDNAVFKLMDCARDIEAYHMRLKDEAKGDDWYTTLNLSRFGGGEAANSVPREAVADYDIRYTEAQSPEEILERVEDIAAKYDVTVDVFTVAPNIYMQESHPYVQQYIQAIESVGETFAATRDYGASDGRFFQEHNIPVILSQPYGLDWHSPDERVSLNGIAQYEAIVSKFLLDFNPEV